MRTARMAVHGELTDHLALDRKAGTFDVAFELPVGLRDLVQSTGIPHVEVERVELNGQGAEWTDRIDDGDTIEMWARYPMSSADPEPRFLLDVHLGKLARLLRLLGLDCEFEPDADDGHLSDRAITEGRTLLTRDRGLLMRASLRRGRWVRATDPERQAAEILDAFCLIGHIEPFARCMECNGRIGDADPDTVDVPDGIRRDHDRFRRCARCERVYWAGSHHDRLTETIDRITRYRP